MEFKTINAMSNCIESIKNNPYTLEIINISETKLIDEQIMSGYCSIYQGDYPTFIKFTPMQKITVKYVNRYFGEQTVEIIGGFDAIEYREVANDMYNGSMMSKSVKAVNFIGEFAMERRILK